MSDFDSPWKEALELYFPAFVALLFPHIHGEVDWSRSYEFLDKELQQVAREGETGRRLLDKLVKIWLAGGDEAWVLIHVEVQAQPEAIFAQRMFVYNYRVFDRYNRVVVSLGVLADDNPAWRPDCYSYGLWGCEVGIRFPVVKLLDFEAREAELEASRNPFAVVVLAHLKALRTREDHQARCNWKTRLVKGLYDRGYQRRDVQQLFRVIDWLMDLPKELEQQFWHDVQQYEQEKHMPYITSIERIGRQEGERIGRQKGERSGRREGLIDGIRALLELRFPSDVDTVMPEILQLNDLAVLQALLAAIKSAASLDDVRAVWRRPGAGSCPQS
jgi:hypothetical protein